MPSEPGTLSMNTYTTNNYVNWFHFKLMLCHFTQAPLIHSAACGISTSSFRTGLGLAKVPRCVPRIHALLNFQASLATPSTPRSNGTPLIIS